MFGGEPQRLARIHKIKAQLFVTDSRVAVACSKYDKGGSATPFGLAAVPLAVGITAVSKVRAARRRRGKMLVGHIHYSRLLSVGFTEWRGIGSHNRLRLTTLDQTVKPARVLALDVTLSKQQSGRELARTIAQLASSYRLGNETDLSDEARQELEALKVAPRLTPEPKSFATYTLISPDDAVVPRPA